MVGRTNYQLCAGVPMTMIHFHLGLPTVEVWALKSLPTDWYRGLRGPGDLMVGYQGGGLES